MENILETDRKVRENGAGARKKDRAPDPKQQHIKTKKHRLLDLRLFVDFHFRANFSSARRPLKKLSFPIPKDCVCPSVEVRRALSRQHQKYMYIKWNLYRVPYKQKKTDQFISDIYRERSPFGNKVKMTVFTHRRTKTKTENVNKSNNKMKKQKNCHLLIV